MMLNQQRTIKEKQIEDKGAIECGELDYFRSAMHLGFLLDCKGKVY